MAATIKLDRYRYISALGSGGMATVVLAEDTILARQVALKRVNISADPRGHSRLRREALIGASVSHPNLVSIYDVVTSEDGDEVVVMEYVPGENLRDALLRETRLPPSEALRILEGVAGALDAIHREGIVHRDIKPANILLGAGGRVKLADLGVAAVPDRTRITSAGALVGTFRYMAPEQLSGARASPAIDIYALSAVAFEALSGRKVRTEDTPLALAHAISTQPPPDLRNVWPEAPAAAARVLMRGMANDPDERPRRASELVGQLGSTLESAATAQRSPRRPAPGLLAAQDAGARVPRRVTPQNAPPPAPHRSRARSRRGLSIAGLVSLVGLLVALVVLTTGGGPNSPHRLRASSSRTAKQSGHQGKSSVPSSHSSTSSSRSAASTSPTAPRTASATQSAANPVSAVETFYHLAAAHGYAQAWALADPAFRAQLGGYPSFEAGQSGDRSITFDSAQVINESSTAATVAIHTTSVRDNGTQHCAGTVDLVRGTPSGAWALHQIDINCT